MRLQFFSHFYFNISLLIFFMHTRQEKMEAFGRFLDVLDELRQKCPWDMKQTNESLRPNTIEEVYELSAALLDNDVPNICKELGDVLLHVAFYARISEEQEAFDMADVCNRLTDKLIFRHPHIYHPSQIGKSHPRPLPFTEGEEEPASTNQFSSAKTADEVLQNWEQIKLREKGGNKRVLDGVPAHLPSLIKAYRMTEKAANVGFDWERPSDVWAKVKEEISEFESALCEDNNSGKNHKEEELGDLIFSLVNAARLYNINPDTALELTNRKFRQRFQYVEEKVLASGRQVSDVSLAELDALWNEAKKQ